MTPEQRFDLIARYVGLADLALSESEGAEAVSLLLRAALDQCRFGAEFAAELTAKLARQEFFDPQPCICEGGGDAVRTPIDDEEFPF